MHMRIDFDLLSSRRRRGVPVVRRGGHRSRRLPRRLGVRRARRRPGALRTAWPHVRRGRAGAACRDEAHLGSAAGLMNPGRDRRCRPRSTQAIRHLRPAKDRKLLTLFAYPDDNHDFAQAQRRCVGIGKCRQSSGGVMCPSYQATREEMHSTRGRAHLLWEMLQGDLVTDGWRSTEVRDALDLCLSCKGCLSDCPVNVDMATYKAEFTAPPLRRQAVGPAAVALVDGLAAAVVAARVEGAATGQPDGAARRCETAGRDRAGARDSRLRRADLHVVVRRPGGTGPATHRGRSCCGRTVHQLPCAGGGSRRGRRCWKPRGSRSCCRTGPVCCGLTWISTGQLKWPGGASSARLARLAPHLAAGTPIVGTRAELHCGAAPRRGRTSARRPARRRAGHVDLHLRGVPHRSGWQPPQVVDARRSCRRTATSTPSSALTPTVR